MPPDIVKFIEFPTLVETLAGLPAILLKFRIMFPLVPTVIVIVAVWFGVVFPSEAGVSVVEVAVRAVVVFVEVKEKTLAVPGV